ncbi:IclR family transcriptional regulator [Halorubrum ezzemoulense]|uniref:IclR family transcriptional regulator n=1 Tax=Halorubrum ezzemoulense TaxID=337243 RepID=A0A256J1N2_HALEZ|nr:MULTISPECIES: IclR family transcriptional regulator [Halorubrum]OYR62583.1 IclR family transcriptional regulator [Halorubrum ezzemoulense]OYR77518.1 IclR family transcriptional regulator [Halorubrum ezzemoulense]PHQ42754.1 IclR family transcriptional regulator [Halorubrum sp. C191]QAY21571.1 IclR family transcriptional regulator [Halorubrum ezzemoulense]
MTRDDTPNAASVGATERSFSIIEQLGERGGCGVSELAESLSISKSTVHNHLQTLRSLGYVVQDGDEYRLGLQFLGLGDRARQHHDLYYVAKPETDSLVEAVGERAQVMVEDDGVGIYIYQSLADQAVRTDSHIGTVVDLHATSVGKAYLAYLPDDRLDEFLEAISFTEQTPDTLTEVESLRAELDDIAERGYAFNDEERTVGMRAVGAPILSADDDRVLGAISVSGPTTRMKGTWYREEVPEMVTQSAQIIGIRATYS